MFKSFQNKPTIWIGNISAFLIFFTASMQFANAAATPTANIKAKLLEYLWAAVAAILVSIAGYVSDAMKKGITSGIEFVKTYCANTQINEVLDDINAFAVNETDKIEKLVIDAYANDNKIDQAEIDNIVIVMFSDFKNHYGENKMKYFEKFRPMAEEWIKARIESAIKSLIVSFRSKLSKANTPVADTAK